MKKLKLAVLVSGEGSNLQAILEACQKNILNAEVSVVVSNKAQARGLERARNFNIPALLKTLSADQRKSDYDRELAEIILPYQPDWIVLAGWMRILSRYFLDYFPERVINLHPALPGAFPGLNAISRAFEAYQRGEISHTGVMIHKVPDEGVDCGPVLNQTEIAILPGDTLETLTARIHQAEHALLIKTLVQLTN